MIYSVKKLIEVNPMMQVGVGKIRLDLLFDRAPEAVLVPPQKAINLEGEFLTPSVYRSLYESGIANIMFTWDSRSGRTLHVDPFPFTEEYLLPEPVVFEVRD